MQGSNLMNSALHTVYQSRSTPPSNTPTRSPSHPPDSHLSAPTVSHSNVRTDNIATLRWTIDTQGLSRCASDGGGVGNGTLPQQGSDPPVGQDSVEQLVKMADADQMDRSAVQSEEVTNTGSSRVGVPECRASPLSLLPSSPPLPLLPESSNTTSAGTKRSSGSTVHEEAYKKGSLKKKKRRVSNRDRTHRSGTEEDRAEGLRVPVADSGRHNLTLLSYLCEMVPF